MECVQQTISKVTRASEQRESHWKGLEDVMENKVEILEVKSKRTEIEAYDELTSRMR